LVRRPQQIRTREPLTQQQIDTAVYVGSNEHNDGIARRPKKQNTTICNRLTAADRDQATTWVRQALLGRNVKYLEGDKDFPSRIWCRDEDGQFWIGYCINGVLGQYKGWPVEEDECRAVFD
jgi:hypothetical protein